MIVDDSAVVRGLLAKALESESTIAIAGTAMHGEAALRLLRKLPVDVVILDVEMPVMDGLTALPMILEEFPGVRVIMASALTFEGAETSVQALALGAAACIAKPVANSTSASIDQLSRELVPLVKALVKPEPASPSASALGMKGPSRRPMSASTPAVVVIGTSTGGPAALSLVLRGLSADFPLPILIVQHMPPLFTPMLAKHLQQDGGRPCTEAVDGAPIQRGHTYVAPGDFHLYVDKQGARLVTGLNQAPPEHYCRPSVNPLFESAAQWYGRGVLAVMLTGMGEDGIEGTRKVVELGGTVIAQDQASSVVWGMPAAVVREELADQVLPLDCVAAGILRLCHQEVACG
jgi:two-component system chemotaxis response regulator CheB